MFIWKDKIESKKINYIIMHVCLSEKVRRKKI